MKFDPNDPQLTAYVLNELSAADRAEVDAMLATNPEAVAFIEELRVTTGLLATSLAAEPDIALDPERRAAITDAARNKPTGRVVAFPWWRALRVSAGCGRFSHATGE